LLALELIDCTVRIISSGVSPLISRIGFKSRRAAQLNPRRGMVARFFSRAVLHVDTLVMGRCRYRW
jgi:hypothetical protein